MTEITPTPDYRKAVEKIIERAVLRSTNRVIGVKDIVRRSEIAGEEIDDATTAILILLPPPAPESDYYLQGDDPRLKTAIEVLSSISQKRGPRTVKSLQQEASLALLAISSIIVPPPEPTPEPTPVAWKFRCLRRRQVGITMDRNEVARRMADDWEIEALVSADIVSPAPNLLSESTTRGLCECARCLRIRRHLAQEMEKR